MNQEYEIVKNAVSPKLDGESDALKAHIFSVCTLVTNLPQYAQCLASFRRNGFDDGNTQFLWIDNTEENRRDGYSGIAEFVRRSSAKYIVVCHQDVELIAQGFDDLVARLSELDWLDPNWAIVGNAGLSGLTRFAIRISDPVLENVQIGNLPMRVDSLDENFLLIRADALLAPSADLAGFHFYGLDLCIQARLRGCAAYVIDFHLRHSSAGNRSRSFFEGRSALERKYAGQVAGRIVRTTCDIVFLGWCMRLRFLRWPLSKMLRLLGKLGFIYAI